MSERTPVQTAAAAEAWARDLPARYIGTQLTQEPVTLLLEAADHLRVLDRAYRQACTNLATVRPDLTRDLSVGETADLYYEALLAGWAGIEGYKP